MSKETDLISLKTYNTQNDVMVAACDYELLGKCFEEGECQIDVSPEFYQDLKVNPETFLSHLDEATIINLVGERVIELAINAGVIDECGVIRIGGVPHAQVFRM